MKKHIIAAAVAAAVAVPAMAQVTIGGNIDTAYTFTNSNSSGKSQGVLSTGLISTPTLSLSGTEDLGGGLKASFRIITRLHTDEPISTSTTTAATGTATAASSAFTLGDRGMLVAISGGFGEVALGRSDGTLGYFSGGSLALSGVLDRVRITTVNGTDTFDAGTINIFYE
jgi:predicted porin